MKAFFSFMFSFRTIVFLLVVGGLAAGGWYYYVENARASVTNFRKERVEQKNLAATITATGTLEPEQVIDVGAQVAGLIQKFGPADPDPNDPTKSATPNGPVVDYCTEVKPGQILAWIDPTIYQAQVNQAKAALQNAQANLKKSQANREGLMDTYKRDMASPSANSDQQIVTDKAAYQVAVADCAVQDASIAQAEANLKLAQTNLDYCTIKAPPDSSYTIVDRRVSIGQTVVASLSAPSLFLLAKDLMRMQVWASVNEADVGNIHIGQEATFTVDARPGKIYKGIVSQIRLNASMTQNVVTYTVVVNTTNKMIDVSPLVHSRKPVNAAKPPSQQSSDPALATKYAEGPLNTTPTQELELLPYLTANLTFHVANRENALLVPNAALRWRPQLQQVEPKYKDEYENSLRKKATRESSNDGDAADAPKHAAKGADKDAAKAHTHSGGAASRGMVWVQVPGSNLVRPIKLVTGLTDGAMTEVVSVVDTGIHEGDSLDEGAELVTGENATPSAEATTNPFAPKMPWGQKPKKPEGQQ